MIDPSSSLSPSPSLPSSALRLPFLPLLPALPLSQRKSGDRLRISSKRNISNFWKFQLDTILQLDTIIQIQISQVCCLVLYCLPARCQMANLSFGIIWWDKQSKHLKGQLLFSITRKNDKIPWIRKVSRNRRNDQISWIGKLSIFVSYRQTDRQTHSSCYI